MMNRFGFGWIFGGALVLTITLLFGHASRVWANPKNGDPLIRLKRIGDVQVELIFIPVSDLLKKEIHQGIIQEEERENRLEELAAYDHFRLKISIPGHDGINITNYGIMSMEEQQQRLYYLAYEFKDDIYMQIGEEKSRCALYHFERSFDLSPYRSFFLAFSSNEDNKHKDRTIVIDADPLNTGPVKFKFDYHLLIKNK